MGSRTAAEELVSRSSGVAVRVHAAGMSGRLDVAEDIVQDAFVRAPTNLSRFDFRFRFRRGCFTIAKRLYVNVPEAKPAYDVRPGQRRAGPASAPECSTIDGEVTLNAKASTCSGTRQNSDRDRRVPPDWPDRADRRAHGHAGGTIRATALPPSKMARLADHEAASCRTWKVIPGMSFRDRRNRRE